MTDKLQEVTEVAVVEHPRRGILLLHSPARRWHFPDGTVGVHERWDVALRRGVEAATGISDLVVRSVLGIQNFGPGVVDDLPQYGVFFLCTTESAEIRLGEDNDGYGWVKASADLKDLELFHPLMVELVENALRGSGPLTA